jgi:hypothetical protein
MSAPNRRLCNGLSVATVTTPARAKPYTMKPTTNVDTTVPSTANSRMDLPWDKIQ